MAIKPVATQDNFRGAGDPPFSSLEEDLASGTAWSPGWSGELTFRRRWDKLESMAESKFLTKPRKIWLASFFKNATVVMLAGIVGSEVFLWCGLLCATEESKGGE